MLPKVLIILKNASIKSCPKWNFLQKTQWMHVIIVLRSRVRGRQTFTPFQNKYYYVVEWKSRFTSGLNVAESTDCIKKYFKQKLHKMKFPTKNSVSARLYLTWEWSWKAFFFCDAYFWQRWVPKLIQFPIALHYKSASETKDEYYEMLQ